MMVLFLYQIL